jgi:hypothetical protein
VERLWIPQNEPSEAQRRTRCPETPGNKPNSVSLGFAGPPEGFHGNPSTDDFPPDSNNDITVIAPARTIKT